MPIYDLGKVVGPQGPKGDKGDTGDAQDCTLVTDWDNAVTTGYYYSVNFDDLNHPPMGDSYYSGSVVAFEGYVRQTVCGLVTNKYMTRFKGGTGIWSTWEYVSPSDAKKITFESNTDILSTTVQSAIQEVYDKKVDAKAILITDWNDAVKPGVYFSSSSAANKPPSPLGDDWFGQVFVYNDRIKQILTHASSAPIGIERWVRSRWSSGQPWSEWSQSFKNATSTSNGLMSYADKAKLDGIDAYTKSDSRQQFANAFTGEKSGSMVNLSDVEENTLLRKATVQGSTTEVLANPEAEKSPDNIASISGVNPTKATACGKNLLTYRPRSELNSGITADMKSDGSVVLNGSFTSIPSGGRTFLFILMQNASFKPGNYYLSGCPAGGGGYTYKLTIALTAPDGSTRHAVDYGSGGAFTVNDGDILRISISCGDEIGTVNNLTFYPQIEEGQTATSYEPYSGTDYPLHTLEPLMSLPNGVCDEYDAVTGVETRRVGKLVFDGTESWKLQRISDGPAIEKNRIYLLGNWGMSLPAANIPADIVCTHYLAQSNTGAWIGRTGICLVRVDPQDGIYVFDETYQTVDSWKAYLAAQHAAGTPVTTYYELAEPIITQHAPATIPVVYPVTNIYADDGNISVSYNRDSNRIYGDLSDALSDKVDKVTGKGLSANDYTTAEKQKLAGIAENANNYTHPTTSGNKHIPSGGVDKQILRWSADGTAVWGNEIDSYTKTEMDALLIPLLIGTQGMKKAMRQYLSIHPDGDITKSVERFFEAAAGTIVETYTSQFYKYSANTSTEGVKLDDNAGLTCIPSTIAAAGTDDYANLPLFACFDCNYTIDADTLEPVIHAIKDVYGEFTSTPTDSFVGVLQMTGWVRRTSNETTKTVEYKAQKADGFEPLPEAVRALDNTVRSFVIHAKYAAGYNSAGLLSSISGVQPATLRTGSTGSTSISHNGQIAKWREWGTQYCGSSLCDIAFVQLMLEIKYAVLGSAQVMQGCRTYSTDTYQAAVSETGVTRVLLTAANAAYFVVGSCVSLGSGNNRAAAACYDICDISKITSVEDVTVDDVAYKAINLDTETTFDTSAGATYIIPQPWATGSTDEVPGNDGSPYSNTSGKEPFKIQGIELMLGMSEVPADTTLYEDAEKYTVYLNRKASDIASGNSGTNPVTVGTIQKETDAGWKSIAELNWDANDQEAYMLAQEVGGSPTTGYCARVYLDAAATIGWREWPAFCGLTGGSSGGFACAGLYAGIGTVGWDSGARACGTGGNRGGFTSAYEEDMPV